MLLALHLGERLGGELGGQQAEQHDALVLVELLDQVGQVARVQLREEPRQALRLAGLEQLVDPLGLRAAILGEARGLDRAHLSPVRSSEMAVACISGGTPPAERM